MAKLRQNALVIGGFDPSAGAGVLADVKTMEQLRVYAMAVNTAHTIQSGSVFKAVNWLADDWIFDQLDILLETYVFKYAKIGLIPSFTFLNQLLDRLQEHKIKVIWDPVLKASAGYDMQHDLGLLTTVLEKVHVLTPNWMEVQALAGEKEALKAAEKLAKHCTVFLKGGHNEQHPGKDYLFHKRSVKTFNPRAQRPTEKHGSGCVFASALTAYLSEGHSMPQASLKAKTYISAVLDSNPSPLGYHKR